MKKRSSKEIFAETLLELSRHTPIDKITVTRLVEESGLSSKTFYNHFQNKSDLMIYIEKSEAERLHRKLEREDYSFHDYQKDGVAYYRKVRHFIQNAVNNTSGQEAYGKIRAEAAYQTIYTFLLKMNGLDRLTEELAFALRLYVFGLVEMFERHVLDDSLMSDEKFVELCEESMPESLKPYLLK
ncbi:MAG: TetR family transcriptional regulator [Eubacterium sp.]|nr:TetR family transcriptional regulator [Eubacterium sp.]